jgi:PPOX class probable F420-dependent enzyme
MAQLTPLALQLLRGKNLAAIATINRDGSPQTTFVWIDTDGTDILFNTAAGRLKTKNLERDGRASIAIVNAENPYEQAVIRGHVTAITTDGADAHIDAMARKYLGQDTYPFRQPGEVRVIVRIAPDKVG